MRVIAGELKGRRLEAPDLPGLRPTSDRVREAMFDALEARRLVEGSVVLDLFAGSGALGIEALSRGAARVAFVESDARALRAIEANLASVGDLAARGRVVRADVLAYLEKGADRADLALVDPPYSFDGWQLLVARLAPVAEVILLEHSRAVEVGPQFETIRLYRHGGTLLTLARRSSESGSR